MSIKGGYGTVIKDEGTGGQSSALEYAKTDVWGVHNRSHPHLHLYTYYLYAHSNFCTNVLHYSNP